MKDLAAIAAKYDTRRKPTCKVCDLKPDRLEMVRALRNERAMSIRGVAQAIHGEFGIYVGDTTVQKHFSRHEGRA